MTDAMTAKFNYLTIRDRLLDSGTVSVSELLQAVKFAEKQRDNHSSAFFLSHLIVHDSAHYEELLKALAGMRGDIESLSLLNTALMPVLEKSTAGLSISARISEWCKEYEQAGRQWQSVLKREPNNPLHYVRYAEFLKRSGFAGEALSALETAVALGSNGLRELDGMKALERELRITGMNNLNMLSDFSKGRSIRIARTIQYLGKSAQYFKPKYCPIRRRIMFATSTLGPGGAERQLANMAIGFKNRSKIPFKSVLPLVCANGLNKRKNGAFYADVLINSKVPVVDIRSEPINEISTKLLNPEINEAISILPSSLKMALNGYFNQILAFRPYTLSAWQDSTVIIAGLAGLLAGVPNIVASFRSLPPYLRGLGHEYFRDALKVVLEAPNVRPLVNSKEGAVAYSDWLDIPVDRFHVLYNGLDIAAYGIPQTDSSFDPAAPVIGCVMRFDENKRPNLWLDIFLGLKTKVPSLKGILVGEGPLLKQTQELANRMGLDSSLTFTGLSNRPLEWMAKMDVFLLTSRVEGVPNVLIEAQSLGIPVVTTPAGGAHEALIDGETGMVLSTLETERADLAAARIADLIGDVARLTRFSANAIQHARVKFSLQLMRERAFGIHMRES